MFLKYEQYNQTTVLYGNRRKPMIVNVFLKLNFDDSIPQHEVEDIVKSGEFFPANVVECETSISSDEQTTK